MEPETGSIMQPVKVLIFGIVPREGINE